MLRFLLDSGADIDQTNSAGESALLLAVSAGSPDAVAFLLERGATCASDRLIAAAAESRSLQVFNLLIARRKVVPSRPALLFALNAATRATSLEIVKRLLELGAPADPTDVGLQPAHNPLRQLDFDCGNGTSNSLDVVHIAEILISHGAPLNHIDDFGKDPLMCAVKSNHTVAANTLISRGARIHQVETSHGANALQLAIMHLEDILNAPTSLNRQQASDACLSIFLLLCAMDRQENRSQLAKDAVNRAEHRIVQDMIVGTRYMKSVAFPSTDLLLSLLDGRKQPSANFTLFLQKHQDSLLSTGADPSFDDTMRKHLVHHGFVHPVIDVIMPFLKALPYMAPSLLGKREENVQFDLGAFCNGMLALLNHRLDSNEQIISLSYAQLPVDDPIKLALLNSAKNMLRKLAAHGDDVEVRKLSPCFSRLFEICLENTSHD